MDLSNDDSGDFSTNFPSNFSSDSFFSHSKNNVNVNNNNNNSGDVDDDDTPTVELEHAPLLSDSINNVSDETTNSNLLDDLSAAIEAINEATAAAAAVAAVTSSSDSLLSDPNENQIIEALKHHDLMMSSTLPLLSSTLSSSSFAPLTTSFLSSSSSSSSGNHQSVPGICTFRLAPLNSVGNDAGPMEVEQDLSYGNLSKSNNRSTLIVNSSICSTSNMEASTSHHHHHHHPPPPPPTVLSSSSPMMMMTMMMMHWNFRPVLRSLFEKALIEQLWMCGEMGPDTPQSLLLTMWFFISKEFGIGCRTDHAKLTYGNIMISLNAITGQRQLQFVRTSKSNTNNTKDSVCAIRPRHPDHALLAKPNRPDRCPVELFELFCSYRPNTASLPHSPFYLQPERSLAKSNCERISPIWFANSALGKNKIGSMLNAALQNIGMPVGKQVNVSRLCDVLTAAAFSSAGGIVGEQLRQLLTNYKQLNLSDQLQQQLTDCAQKIVQLSTTPGSSIHDYLMQSSSSRLQSHGGLKVGEKPVGASVSKPRRYLHIQKKVQSNSIESCHANGNTDLMSDDDINLSKSLLERAVDPAMLNDVKSVGQSRSHADCYVLSDKSNSQVDCGSGPLPKIKLILPNRNTTAASSLTPTNDTSGRDNTQSVAYAPIAFNIVPTNQNSSRIVDVAPNNDVFFQTLFCNHQPVINQQSNNINPIDACPLSVAVTSNTCVPLISTTKMATTNANTSSSVHHAVIVIPNYTNQNALALDTSTNQNETKTNSIISTALPLDENMIDISRLACVESFTPINISSSVTNTPIKSSIPSELNLTQLIQNEDIKLTPNGIAIHDSSQPNVCLNHSNGSLQDEDEFSLLPTDDIRIDLRKTGGGSGRSVKLELRELLDLVVATSGFDPSVLSTSVEPYKILSSAQRTPIGLVTQLLWRTRALDNRGPWILTFSMWWLVQHYFGIGSRMHHVRLRWNHVRLVFNTVDPITGLQCDAIEYVGPMEFSTTKVRSLLVDAKQPHRRVYPSSGWAEPEIVVASSFNLDRLEDRPRVRPLDTDPSIPPIGSRSGPDFVELYKQFCRRRHPSSMTPNSPFYVQPLQNSSPARSSTYNTVWFGTAALGKNRIGALMRNIVDKVVRPNLNRVASGATQAATNACILAAHRAATSLKTGNAEFDKPPSLHQKQQLLMDKLSCLLGIHSYDLFYLDNQMTQSFSSNPPVDINSSNVAFINSSITGQQLDNNDNNNNNNNNVPVRLSTTLYSNPIANGPYLTSHDRSSLIFIPTNPESNSSSKDHSSITFSSSAALSQPSSVVVDSKASKVASNGDKLLANCGIQQIQPPSILQPLYNVKHTHYSKHTTTAASNESHDDEFQIHLNGTGQNGGGNIVTTGCNDINQTQHQLIACLDSSRKSNVMSQSPMTYLTSNGTPMPINLIILSNATSSALVSPSTSEPTCLSQSKLTTPLEMMTNVTFHPNNGNIIICPNEQQFKSHTDLDVPPLLSHLHPPPPPSSMNDTPTHQQSLIVVRSDATPLATAKVDWNPNVVMIKPMVGPEPSASTSMLLPACNQLLRRSDGQQLDGFGCRSVATGLSNSVIQPTPNKLINLYAVDQKYRDEPQTNQVFNSNQSAFALVPFPVHSELDTSDDLLNQTLHNLTSSQAQPAIYQLMCSAPTDNTAVSNGNYADSNLYSSIQLGLLPDTHYQPGLILDSAIGQTLTNQQQQQDVATNRSDCCQPSNSMAGDDLNKQLVPISIRPPHIYSMNKGRHSVLNTLSLSMTCHANPPEPKPDQLQTLQSVINSASAFQCTDFPAYVEQLFRKGILSGRRPWCLNFTAWFINTLVFEVENRTEHVNLRWGDFKLGQTSRTTRPAVEFIYFVNRIVDKSYYLAASPECGRLALGYDKNDDLLSCPNSTVRCPCPVAIFKALRDKRPAACLDPYSKFYLQPRNVACPDAIDLSFPDTSQSQKSNLPPNSNWFTEHTWGKNKLGGLFAEASKLAGLPPIWLRKHRSRNFFPGGGGSGIGALGVLTSSGQRLLQAKKATIKVSSSASASAAAARDDNYDDGDDRLCFLSKRLKFDDAVATNDNGDNDDDDDDENGFHFSADATSDFENYPLTAPVNITNSNVQTLPIA